MFFNKLDIIWTREKNIAEKSLIQPKSKGQKAIIVLHVTNYVNQIYFQKKKVNQLYTFLSNLKEILNWRAPNASKNIPMKETARMAMCKYLKEERELGGRLDTQWQFHPRTQILN